MLKNFLFYKQPDFMDCGPTCLRMVAKFYGRTISLSKIRTLSETTREGTSLRNIADTAEKIGFHSLGAKVTFQKFAEEAPLPCIVYWQQKHFVIVYKIQKDKVYISDPAHGILKYTQAEFIKNWIGNNANEHTEEGITLLIGTYTKTQKS